MKKIYSYRTVVRRAKKDARDWRWQFWPILKEQKSREPKSEQNETASFEEELFQLGENLIAPYVKKWKEIDQKLKPQYCDAKKDDERSDKNLEQVTKEKEVSYQEYKIAKQKLGEFKPPPLDKKWEFIILFLIGISEFFINSLVFQLFGEDKIKTNIAAMGLGVLLPVLAYWLGYILKQQYRTVMDKIWLIILPLGALGILEVISELRAAFFEGTQIIKILNLSISSAQFTFWFYVINIVFFIGATVISYFASHAQGENYKQASNLYKDTLNDFKKDAQEVKEAAEDIERTESNLEKITHLRAKTHQKLFAEAMMIKENAEWLIKSYKAMNLRHRPDYPPCFKKPHIAPEIPSELTNLDWNCEES